MYLRSVSPISVVRVRRGSSVYGLRQILRQGPCRMHEAKDDLGLLHQVFGFRSMNLDDRHEFKLNEKDNPGNFVDQRNQMSGSGILR
jgi:hypothetical protein